MNNEKQKKELADGLTRFPSPIGELHFSILQNCNGTFIHTSFPSPIGELHFSILIKSS